MIRQIAGLLVLILVSSYALTTAHIGNITTSDSNAVHKWDVWGDILNVTGNIIGQLNITAQYFIGSGMYLTNLPKVDNATYADNSDMLDGLHSFEVFNTTIKVDNSTYADTSNNSINLNGYLSSYYLNTTYSAPSFSDTGLFYQNGTRPMTGNFNSTDYNVTVGNLIVDGLYKYITINNGTYEYGAKIAMITAPSGNSEFIEMNPVNYLENIVFILQSRAVYNRTGDGTPRIRLVGPYEGSDYAEIRQDENKTFKIFSNNGNISLQPPANSPTGNVGVGTQFPNYKLDVNGTINANYLIGDGSNLTNLPVTPFSDTGLLYQNGTRALTGNWDTGQFNITTPKLNLTVATGTAPLTVESTTVCSNLNSDLWDGYQFSDYLNQAVKTTSTPIFSRVTSTNGGNSMYMEAAADNTIRSGNSLQLSVQGNWIFLYYTTITNSAFLPLHIGAVNLGTSTYYWKNTYSKQFNSLATTGTAPLVIASTTKVDNLNVDKVDGYDLNQEVSTTSSPSFNTITANYADIDWIAGDLNIGGQYKFNSSSFSTNLNLTQNTAGYLGIKLPKNITVTNATMTFTSTGTGLVDDLWTGHTQDITWKIYWANFMSEWYVYPLTAYYKPDSNINITALSFYINGSSGTPPATLDCAIGPVDNEYDWARDTGGLNSIYGSAYDIVISGAGLYTCNFSTAVNLTSGSTYGLRVCYDSDNNGTCDYGSVNSWYNIVGDVDSGLSYNRVKGYEASAGEGYPSSPTKTTGNFTIYGYTGRVTNLTIDTGNDNKVDWNYTGEINGVQNVDLNITAISNYLSSCTADSSFLCNVPLKMFSNTTGSLTAYNLTILYNADLYARYIYADQYYAKNTTILSFDDKNDKKKDSKLVDAVQITTYNNKEIFTNFPSELIASNGDISVNHALGWLIGLSREFSTRLTAVEDHGSRIDTLESDNAKLKEQIANICNENELKGCE